MSRLRLSLIVGVALVGVGLTLALTVPGTASRSRGDEGTDHSERATRHRIPAVAQRSGDAKRGFDYMVNGDYVRSGVPLAIWQAVEPPRRFNPLNRDGDNASLPISFAAVDAPNGVRIVVPNCLGCHAASLDGRLIVGLGDSFADFTVPTAGYGQIADMMIVATYGPESPERQAYATARDVNHATAPMLVTRTVGMNPADRLAFLLTAMRDPVTLERLDEPRAPLGEAAKVAPSDTPPLWNVRKKHALYYCGSGRGDFVRLIMSSSLLTLRDTDEAREIEERFVDVLSYLETIEPPTFPRSIDRELAERGRVVFHDECSDCHGTYGERETYPNLLIDLEEIGTDALLAETQMRQHRLEVAHAEQTGRTPAWITTGQHPAELAPQRGYVAPPLDGIWATAPYLHNGSAPDLASLLDSRTRPKYWRRTGSPSDYDLGNRVGWNYERLDTPDRTGPHGRFLYDTTLPGHGNGGHTFGDALTPDERRAVIEYLKSL